MNWYILFVMGGREQAILAYLNRDKELEAFCPKVELIHRKQGRAYMVQKAMFPSYIFIKSSLEMYEFQEVLKQKRNEKSGIIRDLHYEDQIPSLSNDEITWIEHLLDKDAILKSSTGFIEGDQVIVTEGPLQGYESYIVHIDRHKRKATLAFQMLGKEVKLDTALEIVKKIKCSEAEIV